MTHRIVRSAIHAIVVAAFAVAIGGCGVPTGSEVHPIESDDIPATAATTQPEDQPTSYTGRPQIYLADTEGTLVPAPFQAEHASTTGILQDVLDQLTVGPTTAQTEQGLSSFIPPTLTMSVKVITSGTASVALGGDQLPNTNQTTATAQIVLSATSVPGVSSVQLTLNNRVVEAPLLDGVLTTRPLAAADYRSLISPPPPS